MNDNRNGMAYLANVLLEASAAFVSQPSPRAAGRLLRVLLDAQGEDIITDDTALDGLYTVVDYLEHGTVPEGIRL